MTATGPLLPKRRTEPQGRGTASFGAIRSPFRKVPPRLWRSVIVTPDEATATWAWRVETPCSSGERATSARGSRPMRTRGPRGNTRPASEPLTKPMPVPLTRAGS